MGRLFEKVKEKMPKKLLLLVLVAHILAGVSFGGYKIYQDKIRVIPEELLAEALDKTLTATSYSYTVALEMTTNGQLRNLTEISGIKANETDFYLKGEMYESAVEIYQFADSTYQRDPVSGKWMVFPTSVTDMELMMTEINPMVNFDFTQYSQLTYLGVEKLNKKKQYVLQLKPVINNKFLQLYWENFQYTLWIDRKDKYITQGVITANNIKTPANTLSLQITLADFNQKFVLEKPEGD